MSMIDLQTSSSSSFSSHFSASEKEEPVNLDPEQLEEMRELAKKATEYSLIGCVGVSAIGGATAAIYLGQPQAVAAITAASPVVKTAAVECTRKIIDDGHCDDNLVRSHDFKKRHCVIL